MYDRNARVVSVDPFRCRIWPDHERFERGLDENVCRDLIESIVEHGQLIPVLGRRSSASADYDLELIYGARRLFVARFLKKNLLVRVADLSDRDAAIALDVENCQRKDLSPYERGLSYAKWLRAGYFRSQEDIAKTLQVSASQVSRLLKLAKLPSVIVAAFSSGLDICESWAVDLAEAIEEPERRKYILQRARALNGVTPRPPAEQVYRQLRAPAHRGRCPKTHRSDKVVSGAGLPLFRIRHQHGRVTLIIPAKLASAELLVELKYELTETLRNERLADTKSKSHSAAVRSD